MGLKAGFFNPMEIREFLDQEVSDEYRLSAELRTRYLKSHKNDCLGMQK